MLLEYNANSINKTRGKPKGGVMKKHVLESLGEASGKYAD